LEESILKFGIPSKLHLMESSGGIVSADLVKSKPAFMIESGPAGGVIEAAFLGKQAGYNNMVTFDMGGTTAKMGLIEDGNITTTSNFEVGAVARAGKRMGGSGYPVKLPFIELIEIGAGGGSIAWIDSGNMLRVGPQSAGADPGPACYNIGGTEPTVTDANVVLGRINSNYFLGGEIELDATKSHEAIKEKIADVLGMDLMEAAQGIIDITNANMLRSLKVVTTGRGIDPRDYVLIAFGGAGPVCAAELGKELGVCQVLIPKTASVHSALGLLVSDIRHDFLRTKKERIADINFKSLTNSYQELENQAHATLMKENIPENKMSFVRSVDMRYIGQSYELRVPVPGGELNGEKMNDVLKSFHDLHLRTYAHNMTDQPLEIVTIRVAGFGETLKPPMKRNKKEGKSPEHSFKYKRPVYFKELGKVIQCSCFDGDKLMTGNTISGPAIIEEKFTTMIVPPDCEAEMDEYTNMVISVKK
jgi:N-methylhydantoinase A